MPYVYGQHHIPEIPYPAIGKNCPGNSGSLSVDNNDLAWIRAGTGRLGGFFYFIYATAYVGLCMPFAAIVPLWFLSALLLALLAVLKLNKPILILDEPYNGLDLESAHLLTMILTQLQEKGKTILISSHIYETLTSCCDFIHYIKDGQIEHNYPKNEFDELQILLRTTIEDKMESLMKNLE